MMSVLIYRMEHSRDSPFSFKRLARRSPSYLIVDEPRLGQRTLRLSTYYTDVPSPDAVCFWHRDGLCVFSQFEFDTFVP